MESRDRDKAPSDAKSSEIHSEPFCKTVASCPGLAAREQVIPSLGITSLTLDSMDSHADRRAGKSPLQIITEVPLDLASEPKAKTAIPTQSLINIITSKSYNM
jgi:hypothetical protein